MNLVEGIIDEIIRVTELRLKCKMVVPISVDKETTILHLAMMKKAIIDGKNAVAYFDDPLESIRAYQELQRFKG